MSTKEIVLNIDKAIASHGMWKMRLRNAIKTHTSEFDVAFVKSPHNCEFGKWLDKDKFFLSSHQEYSIIFDLHKKLHFETARIMDLALSRKDKEASAAIAIGSDFATLSSKLTITMMNWKKGLKEVA